MSDSISNQKAMIIDYINQHENLIYEEEYIDDGYSGTNYERPGFIRMLEDIKKKKIDCVIVKDLSRLGRNYIETGRYLENIFPMYNVRFISILDHYDNVNESGDVDQIIVPFKNLINDAYCRDISMKIRSHFEIKRKSGQFIGSFATYGYEKDSDDKNHLVIDPYAAEVVRYIFKQKIDGLSAEKIAEKLNEMGVLNPSEYKRSIGLNFNMGYRCGPEPKWSPISVIRVLKNEIYTGTMVQGINQKINYRVQQSRRVPQEEWIRVPNTHEAIISKEQFNRVQRLMELDTRVSPDRDSLYLFSGILYCADCGQNLVRRKVHKKDKVYTYYHCSTYKNGEGCSSHLISDLKLEKAVFNSIHNMIDLLVKAETIITAIEQIPENNYAVRMFKTQINALIDEIERYKELKTKLYIDKVEGVIGIDEYKEINLKFTHKIEEAERKCDDILQKKERFLSMKENLPEWLRDFKQYQNATKLTRRIVVTLIDKIIVYSKNEIKIIFHYADEINGLLALANLNDLYIEENDSEENEICVM